MTEHLTLDRADYSAYPEDSDGDNIAGENASLEIDIPAAKYAAGKHATASDTNLMAGNIKDDIPIFGVTGTYAGEVEPATGDDITGENGALEIDIPAAKYAAGKHATASDTNLLEGNIKNAVAIFGVTGTLQAATGIVPTVFAGGTGTASRDESGHEGSRAFDGSYTSNWQCSPASLPEWVMYHLATGVTRKCFAYIIFWTSQNFPTAWKFQGSLDGTTWDDLDSRTGITFTSNVPLIFSGFACAIAYHYFRFLISAANGTNIVINEIIGLMTT